jgi:hypothetical protein
MPTVSDLPDLLTAEAVHTLTNLFHAAEAAMRLDPNLPHLADLYFATAKRLHDIGIPGLWDRHF